jgi:hypothetical protein
MANHVLDPTTKRLLPWVVAIAFFMQTLDGTILNTTLPTTADTCSYDYNLGSPAISSGKHDVVGDPKFVDAANHNFKLAAGSAAIDASTHNAATDLDLDGVQRPQGKAYDIGAYEAKP